MTASSQSSRLFKPLQLGRNVLSNRVALAPLTRYRADDQHVPLVDLVKEYYTQRSSYKGTLLITEATFISARAAGYSNAPGIWSDAQIMAWKEIVDGVHKAGGVIFLQLWALGRVAPRANKEKENSGPVEGPSAVQENERSGVPKEMTEEDIQQYIKDYAQAAKNAVDGAGFDGVEIHGANGYLVDQFIQDMTNLRSDAWGGSVEKRARFAIEVTKAVVDAVGADRSAIRLSPYSTFQGMRMKDPNPQFSYVVQELKKLKLAYLHITEPRISGNVDVATNDTIDGLVNIWAGTSPILIAGGYKAASAKAAADEHYKDKDVVIVFGRYFIANPDLVYRLEKDIEFTQYDRKTFYVPGSPVGYTDQAFSDAWKTEHKL